MQIMLEGEMKRYLLRTFLPAIFVLALTCGLIGQFVWKMVYFPEPLLPVILELIFIVAIAGYIVYQILRK